MQAHDRGMAAALAAGGIVLEVGGPAGLERGGRTRAAVGRDVGNVGGRARRPKPKRRLPPEALTDDEVRRLLAACGAWTPTGLRNRAMIALLYRAGLPIG